MSNLHRINCEYGQFVVSEQLCAAHWIWECMEKHGRADKARYRRLPLPPLLPANAANGGKKTPLFAVIYRYAALNRIARLLRRSVMKTNRLRRNSLRRLIFCREYICFSFSARVY